MAIALEIRIAAVVADRLGVDVEDLRPDVSLVDDLAADSLDLLDIALAIEADLGRALPRRFLDAVRTYGDLLDRVFALPDRRLHRRGAELDVEVPRDTTDTVLAWLRTQLRRASARGVGIQVRRA